MTRIRCAIRDKIAASKRKGLWMGGYVPLGYDAAGRTLTINKEEAKTIRAIYQLYEDYQAISAVTKEASRLGLRSKRYLTNSGRDHGGQPLSRGHSHKILTNPLYAGRIAHKGETYDGQHAAIIEPEQWERIQQLMQDGAARQRGRANSGRPPMPLTGKLFDDAGDRLSPVHTTKQGKRYDYYISKSLKAGKAANAEPVQCTWRLLAPLLEAAVSHAIRKHLATAATRDLLRKCDAQTIAGVASRVSQSYFKALAVIERVEISPGKMNIRLGAPRLADALSVPVKSLNTDALIFDAPFTYRRRGAETKLMFAGEAVPRNETLLRNVAMGHRFLADIKSGQSTSEIAVAYGLSKKRVQQIVEFAFLSPASLQMLLDGKQPYWLTTAWCLTHEIPTDWAEQVAIFNAS